MNSQPLHERISPAGLKIILIILAVFALLALCANVQKYRRDKIETVTVTPVATPVPSPSP